MNSQRVLAIAVFLFSACGDDSTLPIVDSGPSDAGQDVIRFETPDAQTPEDAGADAPSDTGSDVSIDAGACLFSLEDGLSDACFPACVEGSLAALRMCIDYDCYLDIFRMGDGVGLQFDTGSTADNILYRDYLTRIVGATESCHQCEILVTRACEFDLCPEETTAFFNCLRGDDGPGSCFPRSMAVTACATAPANDGAYRSCYVNGLDRCLR